MITQTVKRPEYTRYNFSFTHEELVTMASRGPHGPSSATGDVFLLLPQAQPGFYWDMDVCKMFFDFTAGAYSNLDDNFKFGLCSGLNININPPWWTWLSAFTSDYPAIFQIAGRNLLYDRINTWELLEYEIQNGDATTANYDLLLGQAIYLLIDNVGSDLEGGDPANKLVIQLDAAQIKDPLSS